MYLNHVSPCRLNIKIGGQTLPGVASPIVAGPAELELELILTSPGSTTAANLCVVQVSGNDEGFTPSTAVVIPADSGGPVEVILESSVDLINWTPTLPGVYGTSTQKRFFRVRAQRQ